MAATENPTADALTSFQNMQTGPQVGVASETNPSGKSIRRPQSGPRTYHCGGQVVMPTRNPINMRALYQPQTATAPRM